MKLNDHSTFWTGCISAYQLNSKFNFKLLANTRKNYNMSPVPSIKPLVSTFYHNHAAKY